MNGFVVGVGHSGTTWFATALREVCGLDARHEFMHYAVGPSYGGVEVNGNLWHAVEEIRERHPGAKVLHLVRDGQKVVRTLMSKRHRGPGFTVAQACERWVRWNSEIERHVPPADRYELENLLAGFAVFAEATRKLGAGYSSRQQWAAMVGRRIRPTRHTAPPPREWPQEWRRTYQAVCGPMARRYGYSAAVPE